MFSNLRLIESSFSVFIVTIFSASLATSSGVKATLTAAFVIDVKASNIPFLFILF